jgi:hypothetical protein
MKDLKRQEEVREVSLSGGREIQSKKISAYTK